MTLHRNISGTWRTVSEAYRNIDGLWKRCAVWRNIGGVWKEVLAYAGSQVLTTTPSDGSDSVAGPPDTPAFVQVNATVSATWTYSLLSGSSAGVTLGSSSGLTASVTLERNPSTNIGGRSCTYRVTDTLTGLFVDVSLTVSWNDF